MGKEFLICGFWEEISEEFERDLIYIVLVLDSSVWCLDGLYDRSGCLEHFQSLDFIESFFRVDGFL